MFLRMVAEWSGPTQPGWDWGQHTCAAFESALASTVKRANTLSTGVDDVTSAWPPSGLHCSRPLFVSVYYYHALIITIKLVLWIRPRAETRASPQVGWCPLGRNA